MRRLKDVSGLSVDALRALAPHALKLESIEIDDEPDRVMSSPARPMKLFASRIHFSTAHDDPWAVRWLRREGDWALELCTEASFGASAYEPFELMQVAPPSLRRISVEAAFVERADEGWHLHVRPLDRGVDANGWPRHPAEVLEACEQMLEDFQEYLSLVVIDGGDLGPEIAEQLHRMLPNVPMRFDWSGAPPYDFRARPAAELLF